MRLLGRSVGGAKLWNVWAHAPDPPWNARTVATEFVGSSSSSNGDFPVHGPYYGPMIRFNPSTPVATARVVRRRGRPARGAAGLGGFAGLQRLGEQRRDVRHAQVVAAGAHAVIEHHRAERARHGERLSTGLGRLARALLVDQPGALLHPHVSAAGAAAEGALLPAFHLDWRPDR